MSTRSRLTCLIVAGLLPFSAAGCIVIGGHGWWGPTVWTESTTEKLPIDTTDLHALEVRTHNGPISFKARAAEATEASVTVTKKAGGLTQTDAEAALEAIEVYVEPAGGGTQRIGWRWKGLKHGTWRAQVGFDIKAPGNLQLDAKTHNGAITIEGVTGDVKAVTHNGRIGVDSRDGKLYARTHNGRVAATYAGDDVTLVSHNGQVVADLSRCGVLNGDITTHNGGVEVVVGEKASATLKCQTYNGSVRCAVPLSNSHASRRRLTGSIGNGEGNLDLTTHNGSIRIKKTAG